MASPRATTPQSDAESEFSIVSGNQTPVQSAELESSSQPAVVSLPQAEYEEYKKLQAENAALKQHTLQLEQELAEHKKSSLADEYQRWEKEQVALQQKLDDTKKEFFVATMQKRFRHKKLVNLAEQLDKQFDPLKKERQAIKTERASLYREFETKLNKIMKDSKGTDIAEMAKLLQQRKDELLHLEQEKAPFVQAYRIHEDAAKTLLIKTHQRTKSKLKVNALRNDIQALEVEKANLAQHYIGIEKNWQEQSHTKNNQWISDQLASLNEKRKQGASNATKILDEPSVFLKININRSTLSAEQKQKIDEELFTAISQNNLKKVIACFRNGADVEAYNSDGLTPLMAAVAKPNPNDEALTIASYLLTVKQANPNAKIRGPYYSGGVYELASFVGNRKTWRVREGASPLVFAILSWELNEKTQKIFDLFLQIKADLEAIDFYKYKPLNWAVESHNKNLITYLIKNGAQIDGVVESFKKSKQYDSKIAELVKPQCTLRHCI